MGRAMGFGSEPTFSTHVVRQQRMRMRARAGGGGGAVGKGHRRGIIMFWGYMLRFRMTRVEHLCGKRARG